MNRIVVLALMAIVAATGCRSSLPRSQPYRPAPGPPPSYAEVAAAYNSRVKGLERLWARTVVRMWFRDQNDVEQNEQVEGNCQYVRPSKVLLNFDKVGETYAMLGSDGARYWWIELFEVKRAYVGEVAKATPQSVARVGVKIHPLDVIELLGLTILPEQGEVEWREDKLLVTVPSRFGRARLTLDAAKKWPERIEMLSPAGELLATSELAKFEAVAIKAGLPGADKPWIPTQVRMTADAGRTRVWLDVSDAIIDPSRPRAIAFDLQKLLDVKNVRQVISLDEPQK